MKTLRYMAEAAVLYVCFGFFKLLGPDLASALGGWLGRNFGPLFATSRKAVKNITHALPETNARECRKILEQMWDNLGRVFAEYPHLKTITENKVEYIGLEHIQNLEGPVILFSAHFANWELMPSTINYQLSGSMRGLYREPNNPFVRKLLEHTRTKGGHVNNIPKSKSGVRSMVRVLQEGGKLGVLIDQKYNQGEAVPFLGRPAMTSPAFVQLAQKFSCPLIPVEIRRVKGASFKAVFYPPLKIEGKSEYEAIETAHHLLESWIRENPGQWLWLHRRWDSAALKEDV